MRYVPFMILAGVLLLLSSCGMYLAEDKPVSAPNFSGASIVNLTRPGANSFIPGERVACQPLGLNTTRAVRTYASFNNSGYIAGGMSGVEYIVPQGETSNELRCVLSVKRDTRERKSLSRTVMSNNSLTRFACGAYGMPVQNPGQYYITPCGQNNCWQNNGCVTRPGGGFVSVGNVRVGW